jgi:hypothetical protein
MAAYLLLRDSDKVLLKFPIRRMDLMSGSSTIETAAVERSPPGLISELPWSMRQAGRHDMLFVLIF